ncbi:MAG TPA: MBL fold metallo-hydrolase [Myxococcales bacterium]|jgi:L-ascorbate metabolism protein UlaG (beta-lactamase superfamily)
MSLKAAVVSLALCTSTVAFADKGGVDPAVVKARSFFFGAENVNAKGEVDNSKVIFSWLTNATLAASVKGHIVMLDTFIHRAETVPGRTPFVVEDLLSLKPEAIFLGHGHGDHADNAAWLSAKLSIPIFASAETCIDLQADAQKFFAQGAITTNKVECHDVTSFGSEPGAEVVNIGALEPVASITAFRHLHSGTSSPETSFPITPVQNIADARDAQLYPPGTPHSFTTGGVKGGPVSIWYSFVVHGQNNFTFSWHNTTGDLVNGCTLDRGFTVANGINNCWGPRVAAQVKSRIEALPTTDLEFGSFVSLGFAVNGMRDPIQNSAALQPKIWIPIHQTNAALPTSAPEFEIAYQKQLNQMVPALTPAQRPEARWMIDPIDYVKPLVFDPGDERWKK